MLDRPTAPDWVTAWTPQPVGLVVVVALAVLYLRGVRRLGRPWPASRWLTFALGLVLLLWTTCGFPGVYARSLFWVWTTQQLLVWLVVPVLLLAGQPLQLAQQLGHRWVGRVLAWRPVRVVSNPFVGPALVPILSFAIFFGPLPGWSVGTPPVGWLVQVVLLLLGATMALPLAGPEDNRSTLAVGLGLAIGSFELVVDALPGIVLRLREGLASTFADSRVLHDWSPDALRDQRTAGAILWVVAELLDLPFLLIVFRRWWRTDARDAARVDAVLEAERTARGAETDEPWWLSDPTMQERLRRRG